MANTRLAKDRNGTIHATENGRVLLPLYQELGEDGFFLVRDVSPFWLQVSSILRRFRFDRWLKYLPGVSEHPRRPHHLVVDPEVAFWRPVDLFHLLGYRKRRPENGKLVFVRREAR